MFRFVVGLLCIPLAFCETLKIAVKEDPGFMSQDTTGNREGIIQELLANHILPELENLGYGYDITYHVNDVHGSWNDLIDQTQAGTYDLAAATFIPTKQRAEKVRFTPYIHLSSYALAIPTPKTTLDWKSWIRPFEWDMWVVLVGALILIGLLLYLLEYLNAEDPMTIGHSVFVASSLPFGNQDRSPTTAAGKMMYALTWFASLLIVAAYTAKLTTLLTTQAQANGISGSADVAGTSVGVPGGTQVANWAIAKGMIELPQSGVAQGIKKVANGKILELRDSGDLDVLTNQYIPTRHCDKTALEETVGFDVERMFGIILIYIVCILVGVIGVFWAFVRRLQRRKYISADPQVVGSPTSEDAQRNRLCSIEIVPSDHRPTKHQDTPEVDTGGTITSISIRTPTPEVFTSAITPTG